MLCVDVVAECDRYKGERLERGVCTGKEGVGMVGRGSAGMGRTITHLSGPPPGVLPFTR